MSYLDRLRFSERGLPPTVETVETTPCFSESATPPSVESIETPQKASIDTLDSTPPGPFQKIEGVGAPPSPDRLTALYQAWLSGIPEPRVLLTLTDVQVREAIAAGVVSRDLARDSVLLLVKVPKGEAGPGAVGMLAVPKAKWADFSPTSALEAMTWQH